MSRMRNTVQRDLVLQTVRSMTCHPTAEQVYQVIVQKHPTVSKGTVYRNLSLLAQIGLIRRVEVPNSADRFDFQMQKHYHILCKRCSRVYDVDMAYLDDIGDHIRDMHGFSIDEHDIAFKGVCPHCREKE